MLLKTVVGLLIAVVAFVAWRYTSVTRDGDVVGKITPGELVDLYVSIRKQKGGT
jgi:hypothetical protein